MGADTRIGWPSPWRRNEPSDFKRVIVLACGHERVYAVPPLPGETVLCPQCGDYVEVRERRQVVRR